MLVVRDALLRFYWKLEKVFFPQLRFSQYRYYEALHQIVPGGCEWLDLGCGHQMFAAWMAREEQELSARSTRFVGIDLDWQGLKKNRAVHLRVFGNLERLPFPANSFDVVTANMVVEHLPDPQKILSEVHRVLRPGGTFVFHTPNLRSCMMFISSRAPQKLKNFLASMLENRKEEDVFPTCYRMNTLATVQKLAAASGFKIQTAKPVSSTAITALLGPIAILELLYLRMLEAPSLAGLRSNLIVVLRR